MHIILFSHKGIFCFHGNGNSKMKGRVETGMGLMCFVRHHFSVVQIEDTQYLLFAAFTAVRSMLAYITGCLQSLEITSQGSDKFLS